MYNYVDKLDYENIHTSVTQIKLIESELEKLQEAFNNQIQMPENINLYNALKNDIATLTRLLINLQSLPQ